MCFALLDFIEVIFKVGCAVPFCVQELFHFSMLVIVERDYIVVEVMEDLVDSAGSVANNGELRALIHVSSTASMSSSTTAVSIPRNTS